MLKVLIVDDEYDYLEILFNKLNDIIVDNIKIVKICNDGEKALQYIMNTSIDLVLLDLNIPKINGLEILEKIKSNNIDIKVIVISGESEFVVKLLSRKLDVEKILIKPFLIEDLVEAINKIIFKLNNDRIEKDITFRISEILKLFEFNQTNIGYRYIMDFLIIFIIKNYKYIKCTKDLYKEIAKKYNGISQECIGWNISKCIHVMNKMTEKKILKKYFPYDSSPSPKIFLNEILRMYYLA